MITHSWRYVTDLKKGILRFARSPHLVNRFTHAPGVQWLKIMAGVSLNRTGRITQCRILTSLFSVVVRRSSLAWHWLARRNSPYRCRAVQRPSSWPTRCAATNANKEATFCRKEETNRRSLRHNRLRSFLKELLTFSSENPLLKGKQIPYSATGIHLLICCCGVTLRSRISKSKEYIDSYSFSIRGCNGIFITPNDGRFKA